MSSLSHNHFFIQQVLFTIVLFFFFNLNQLLLIICFPNSHSLVKCYVASINICKDIL